MNKLEIVARSQESARAKAAVQLGVAAEHVQVLEEYEPDEMDLQNLEAEEAALPEEERIEGEAVLYVVGHSPVENMDKVKEWLQGLVERFQPGASIELVGGIEDVRAVVTGPDPSIFIGRQGHTLAALQHVVARVTPRLQEGCPPVHLDVGDYRDRKTETLRRIADQAVRRAKRSRQVVSLKPMPSPDRKFLHNYLKSVQGITTQSFGREPFRYISIEPEGAIRGGEGGEQREDRGNREHRGGRGRGRGRGRDGNRGGENRGNRGDDFGNRQEYQGNQDDNRGNRDDRGNRDHRGGRGRGRDGNRGGGRRDQQQAGQFDPYAEERRKMREMAAAFEANEAAEANGNVVPAFEDVGIEETPSRLMGYDESKRDQAFDREKPLVDELE